MCPPEADGKHTLLYFSQQILSPAGELICRPGKKMKEVQLGIGLSGTATAVEAAAHPVTSPSGLSQQGHCLM